MQRLLIVLIASLVLSSPGQTAAEDIEARDQAESRARVFLETLGLGEYVKLYREYLGKKYKESTTEEAFVAQYSIARQQLGGAGTNRRLIDERPVQQLPSAEGIVKGDFYFFRYKTKYPAGNIYEDVYLEREGAAWGIVGC